VARARYCRFSARQSGGHEDLLEAERRLLVCLSCGCWGRLPLGFACYVFVICVQKISPSLKSLLRRLHRAPARAAGGEAALILQGGKVNLRGSCGIDGVIDNNPARAPGFVKRSHRIETQIYPCHRAITRYGAHAHRPCRLRAS
jgi:hypothetical protein